MFGISFHRRIADPFIAKSFLPFFQGFHLYAHIFAFTSSSCVNSIYLQTIRQTNKNEYMLSLCHGYSQYPRTQQKRFVKWHYSGPSTGSAHALGPNDNNPLTPRVNEERLYTSRANIYPCFEEKLSWYIRNVEYLSHVSNISWLRDNVLLVLFE